ncbi:helix-turn-helix domain-containing protein [Fodinisporobacter ferrooxydans]|uniref:Helix-turn-helix domain-containing protein n=1 Tax=Fodinisporobacter ferrooxydans TaxID=2901836 RepID=A0ABY4CR27_9BACL|nr:helix-turn-helix domain-containing protein [Alicyclobacillaceae bacterium MYW30-H2]
MSPATDVKIDKNEYIALQVIDRICDYLRYEIEDVVRHVKTENSDV